jgi:predicted permease
MTTLLNRARMWLRAMFARRREDNDLAREMESHIAMERDNLIRRGVDPREADRQARVAFGGVQRHTEAVRDERGTRWIETLVQDVRYAFRQYRRAPWVAATVIFTLALGLGTSSWLFILTDHLSAHPVAGVTTDHNLVRIRGHLLDQHRGYPRGLAYRELEDLKAHRDVFASVVGVSSSQYLGLRPEGGVATAVVGQFVTSGFFGTLGAKPELGSLLPTDDTPGAPLTVYISQRLWRNAFGRRADVAGLRVYIGDIVATVTGVAPSGFRGVDGSRVDAWFPLSAYAAVMHQPFDASKYDFRGIALLRDGVSRERAEALAKSVGAGAVHYTTHTEPTTTSADLVPVLTTNAYPYGTSDLPMVFAVLGGLSLLVLAIVCTNVSALMLGRAAVRRREVGVRISLGATRTRLIRQLLTESTVLALAGGAFGLLVLKVFLAYMNGMFPDEPVSISWQSAGLTALVALGTGAMCGLSPALHATRASISDVIKGASTGRPHHTRAQRRLIVAQIALSQPLLVVLGLLLATIIDTERSRYLGDATGQTIVMQTETPSLRGAGRDSLAGGRLSQQMVEHVAQIPGVERVAMRGWTVSTHFKVVPDSQAGIAEYNFNAQLRLLGPDYFGLIGAPVLHGREFDKTDVIGAPASIIITSDFAAAHFGSMSPIGRRIACPEHCFAKDYTIIGVVDAAKSDEQGGDGVRVYAAASQWANFGGPTILARVRSDAAAMIGVMRTRMGERFPDVAIQSARTQASIEADLRRENFLGVAATGGAGLIALLLSAIGLYGVVSLAVAQRTREIGVRVALGATSGGIVRHFFRDGVKLSVIGCAIGLPASIVSVRYFGVLLEYTGSYAWLTGALVAAAVTGIAMLATWWPARRAARVDPLVALRAE